ncbi:class C sortase [Paenibacillus odorifer]|uniref:Class C sortase n=1 Tax=Paenibacillus odorifer TaxID=189426 RepID=A0A1R0ZC56_9BACL|nr:MULTISPECIES: class D sortase [Paenibacillus]AIQ21959.1 sortase [Paenibacillus sp. FSL H7-0737]OMD44994.1 class C sortase [Paenibacillus odorifer]OME66562.1 class C sortase [Paenibacillus odorifer]
MRKFSYVLILAGILIMLYPKANEWYNDWQQDKLLESAELSTSESTPPPDLKSRYAEVTQLLAEESALDAQAQPQETEKPEPEIEVGGKVIALIEIDKIDLKLPVLEGATKANMKHAAAHMKETTPIGEIGNAAIAAHRARTTGRLFNRLNEVVIGDTITVKTSDQTYNYEVYDISVVLPSDVSVLDGNNKDKILTLITCDPLVDPTHRLIVHAKLS